MFDDFWAVFGPGDNIGWRPFLRGLGFGAVILLVGMSFHAIAKLLSN